MEVVVRQAEKADTGAVSELWKELMDYHAAIDPVFTRDPQGHVAFELWLLDRIEDANMLLLLAEVDGEPAGFCQAEITDYPPVLMIAQFGMILNFTVTKSHRRKGIGRAMVQKTLEWMRSRDIGRIELCAATGNEISNPFWQDMGFAPYKTSYYLNLK